MRPRLVTGQDAESGHELAVGQSRGCLAGHLARAGVALVHRADMALQALANRAWSQDQQVLVRGQASRDPVDEPFEVLQAARLARGLWPPTPVVRTRTVRDVAGRPVVRRDVGVQAFNAGAIVVPADDDRLASVDPDERSGFCIHVVCPPACTSGVPSASRRPRADTAAIGRGGA
jgi:hypothetical protein